MARRATGHASSAALLGALALPAACSSGATSDAAGARTGADAARGGHAGNQAPPDAGPAGTGGVAGSTGSGGASDCNANRAPGIPINAGTLSATVDAQTLSGGASILWAAGANTLTLKATDGAALTVVFPGCEPRSYSLPTPSAEPDAIAITYTAAGGEPQWACSYEDTTPGPAHCVVDVTAYGEQRNAPVTGTFSGVLRLRSGTGTGTKMVSAGTFTFERP